MLYVSPHVRAAIAARRRLGMMAGGFTTAAFSARRCHQLAVYDPEQAHSIYQQVVAQLACHPGISLRVGAAFRLVDQPTLLRLAAEGGLTPGENEHTLGPLSPLWPPGARSMCSTGCLGCCCGTVIAHELAHAWQGENAPLLKDPLWREGFAEWVAYQHLRDLGASQSCRANA
ncbi:MAG: hypothetical protein KatS3mg057_3097 [Herpetosiphonaceae bacterium]|nr:MAG: hypothetical protein KatS3mg057_3097 [Herpetosiphonaceae bacterium]